MTFTIAACIIALFFAMNIGASGAAASISIAYGSGAIKKRKNALIICAIAIFLGAFIGGSEVVKTIGSGIVPQSLLSVKVVLIILISATSSLFIANLIGIPLSTSEITVGSVIGVGIALQSLYVHKILVIISFWIIVPVVGFTFALFLGRFIQKLEIKYPQIKGKKYKPIITIFVIVIGFFEAFSAGMNNVANAVGPLVGAGIVSMEYGILIGGLFIALGVLFLGGRVLQTNAKKITSISLLEGGAISGTGAILVMIASVFGLPVPLTQVTSSAIIGIGMAKDGMDIWKKQVIAKILKVWVVSPVFSMVISYGLVKLFIDGDLYTLVILVGVCAATLGTISLIKTIKEDQRQYQENGGGI
ncbi:inorganic phosphate transporter [Litchfieldia salsa]|uniref:Sulfate permease n=1 Tax=Litchfieldia salsa TaxID=930152 RepID=A0A1H0STP0_9BACI|nr:inorganic phosphate transporter [Litchfieldia salsa]SDP45044.1 sulfate permease [Litchfieldia salsa]